MTNKYLFVLWGGLFILCAGLGFIPDPAGVLRVMMRLLSLVFFLPPTALLARAGKAGDRNTVKLITSLAALSLGLTLVLLVLNFLCAAGSQFVGTALYYLLVMVSSPMVCSGYWALSLFLWACLLVAGRGQWKKCKRAV